MPHHPTLFIGLGGSGVTTLAHLKRLLRRSMSREELMASYRFKLFDTDDSTWKDLERDFDAEFKADGEFLSRDKEWFNFGGFNPQRRWQEIKSSPSAPFSADILSWIDPRTAETTFPDQIVTIGAEARRQLGRFCLAQNFVPIQNKIRTELQALNNLRQTGQQEQVHIVVVASSCGGTGSSVFYDILYMLAVLYNEIAHAAPVIKPVIYSPQPYIRLAGIRQLPPELIERYNANAFSFFRELKYAFGRFFSGEGHSAGDFAIPSWSQAQALRVNWQPFGGSLIIDAQREGVPTFIPFENLYPTCAELLFYMLVSAVNANVNRGAINFRGWGDDASLGGSFPRYGSAGFRAIEYPGASLARFLSDRFSVELLADRFLKSTAPAQSELSKTARRLVDDVVLTPLRAPKGKADENSFREFARRQHLSADGNPLQRLATIDEFCTFDSSNPDSPPKVNPATITRDNLRKAVSAVQEEARRLKSMIRKDFATQFGRPSRPDPTDYYGRVLTRFQEEMETAIETWGGVGWTGNPGQEDAGLAWHLMETIAGGKEQAMKDLAESNRRWDALLGNVEGLERLIEDALAAAEKLGGLGRLWSGGGIGKLREKLEAFASKRVELVEEAFSNVLLMLEIEVLTFVGSRDPEVRAIEYFTCQDAHVISILRGLQDQGARIRNWMGRASSAAEAALGATVASMRQQSRSVLTTYEPSLDRVILADGKPGPLSTQCMGRLWASLPKPPNVLVSMTELPERAGVSWRAVCPSSNTTSEGLIEDFRRGCDRFVHDLTRTDKDLAGIVGRSIEDWMASGDVSADRKKQLKQLVGLEQVAVFSPVSENVPPNRPKFRLLLTASTGSDGSIAQQLGHDPGDPGQAHISSPEHPQRVLAVKVYSGLYLEDDFPWVKDVQYYYDRYLNYEPHLWRDGRVRVSGGGSATCWRRGFSVGIAWGFLFAGDKWKSDPNLAAVFTARLKDEPEAYLHEPPIALKRREPHFLCLKLAENMISGDGRVECALGGSGFERVAGPGEYGAAWAAFLKRSYMLENVELFHKWCGGIAHEYANGDQGATIQLVPNQEGRARFFLGQIPNVLSAVRAKRDELGRKVKRSAEDENTLGVLGWVATELEAEKNEIEAAFGSETL